MSLLARHLASREILSPSDLEVALRRQQSAGGSLDTALLELGLLTPLQLDEALQGACGLPGAPVRLLERGPTRPWDHVPRDLLDIGWAIPLAIEDGQIWVAVHPDLPDAKLGQMYRQVRGLQPVVAPECCLAKVAAERTGAILAPRYALVVLDYLHALRSRESGDAAATPALRGLLSHGGGPSQPAPADRPREAETSAVSPARDAAAEAAPATPPPVRPDSSAAAPAPVRPDSSQPPADAVRPDVAPPAAAVRPDSAPLPAADVPRIAAVRPDSSRVRGADELARPPVRQDSPLQDPLRGADELARPPVRQDSPTQDGPAPARPDSSRVPAAPERAPVRPDSSRLPAATSEPRPSSPVSIPPRLVAPVTRAPGQAAASTAGQTLSQRLQSARAILASARERDRITEALVRAAGIIAPRVGLFGVKREGLRVLGAPGSALRLTEGLVIPLPEGGPLDRAVTGQSLLHLLTEPSLSFAVGQPLGIPCVFEPVLAGGRTVLMLYLDRAGVAFDPSERAAVRDLCDVARQSLEALLRLLGWVVPAPASADAPARPHLSPSITRPPEPTAAPDQPAPAEPEPAPNTLSPRTAAPEVPRSPSSTLVARAPAEMMPPAPPPGQVPATLPDRPAEEPAAADAGEADDVAEAGRSAAPSEAREPDAAASRSRGSTRKAARPVITLLNPIRRDEPTTPRPAAAELKKEPGEPRDDDRASAPVEPLTVSRSGAEPAAAPAPEGPLPPNSALVARFAALAAADDDPDAAPARATVAAEPPPHADERAPSRPVEAAGRPASRPEPAARPPSRPHASAEPPPENPAGLPVVDDEPAAPPAAPQRAPSQPLAAAPAPSDLPEATGPEEPAPSDMSEAPADERPAPAEPAEPAAAPEPAAADAAPAPAEALPPPPTSTLHMPNLVAPPGTRAPARPKRAPEPASEPVLVIPKSLRKQTELTAAPHPMGRRSDREATDGPPTLSIPATLINPRSGRRRGKNEPRPEGPPPTLNMPRLVREAAPEDEVADQPAPEALSPAPGPEAPAPEDMSPEPAPAAEEGAPEAPAADTAAAPPAEAATAIADATPAEPAAAPPSPGSSVLAALAPDLREAGDGPPAAAAATLSEEEVEAAIEAYLAEPSDATMARLEAFDAGGLARLAARFPGPIDLANATNFPPPSAHGPLLRACVELGPAITPQILELFASTRPQIRFYAAFLFQELRDPRCLRALADLTLDSDPDVRLIATRVLETYNRSPEFAQAAARVRAELDSRDRERQLLATEGVSTLRDTLAVPRLIDLLAVRDKHVREAALEALCSITAKHHGYRAARWRSWYAEHGQEPRILWVMDGLRHRDAAVRRWAADELVRITGQRIPFPADADRRARDLALRAWQDWWDREGAEFAARS